MDYSDKIIRGAAIENMANENGVPNVTAFTRLYKNVSAKTIITGFVYVSENGRAMQPLQAGIINETQKSEWEKIRRSLPEKELIMQLAHTGRQTTRHGAVGASSVKCTYFKNKAKPLDEKEIKQIISDFKDAALRAKSAGFDGVQIHAAHGYLIHQFISKHTNNRKDKYADRSLFLKEVLRETRSACGADFKLWIKISCADDRGLKTADVINILKETENLYDAVEISYGTMEYPLNIIRGAVPLDAALEVNPLFNKYPAWLKVLWKKFIAPSYIKKFIPFSNNYNYEAALQIKKSIKKPVFLTGGIRNEADIKTILDGGIDKIALCRPFIREPDLMGKLSGDWRSKCTNCNLCSIYCDSKNSLRCYMGDKK
jgi:2,4-dienoyl-CoA reductase-like NADH-dependent reductase (Old Yellow Enzyme family)